MKHRLFVAINLPEEIKTQITQLVKQINVDDIIRENPRLNRRESAFRWLPSNNWHITITFLGYQPDEASPAIIDPIKATVQNQTGDLRIAFDKISFGPIGKRPRMIWLIATNETSKNLALIKNKLEDELVKNGVRFEREKRGLESAHITLARFQASEVEISGGFSLPKIENISFTAESLDLMESHLKRTGAEYEICSRVDLV